MKYQIDPFQPKSRALAWKALVLAEPAPRAEPDWWLRRRLRRWWRAWRGASISAWTR